MANPVVTNNDIAVLVIKDDEFYQDLINFGTAQTHAEGEILARKYVADVVTPAADGGNTGDGVLGAAALGVGGPALVGAYNLECVEAVTNSGRFKLEDPNGKLLTSQIVVPVSGNISFEGCGLKFNLADGATDFIVGDKFSLTTTVDGALYKLDLDAVDGLAEPVALMPQARTEASAANYPMAVLIKAQVRKAILETGAGITLSKALEDKLIALGIIPRTSVEHRILDNQ